MPAFCRKTWTHNLRPTVLDEHGLNWIFLCGNWNYCFWPEDGEEHLTISHRGNTYKRSWAMIASVTRALDGRKIELADPKWQMKATRDDVAFIFEGDSGSGEVPLLDQRVKSINELGKWTDSYGGLKKILKRCEGKCLKLIELLCEMPNWNDSLLYGPAGNERMWILKRAQLLCADLWYCGMQSEETEISKLCKFEDIDQLSAFADYRIPQSLESMGALEYSDHLKKLLNEQHRFQPGEQEEVEIRAVSVHAAHLVANELRNCEEFKKKFAKITDVIVDTFLWTYAMLDKNQCQRLPHHLCRTVFY